MMMIVGMAACREIATAQVLIGEGQREERVPARGYRVGPQASSCADRAACIAAANLGTATPATEAIRRRAAASTVSLEIGTGPAKVAATPDATTATDASDADAAAAAADDDDAIIHTHIHVTVFGYFAFFL